MGVWADYCIICGGPYSNRAYKYNKESAEYDGMEVEIKECIWLTKSYTIDHKERKHSTNQVDCGVPYVGNTSTTFSTCPLLWIEREGIIPAIACHRQCYKLLVSKLDYKLKFGDVKCLLDDLIGVLKEKEKYGLMYAYSFDQEFDSSSFFIDKWLLEDPNENKENSKRILKIWEPLVQRINI